MALSGSAQPATNCVAPPNGLVGWWPGEDHVYDIVGKRFGVLNGDITYTVGKVGRAFAFGGTGGRVRVLESTANDLSRMSRWTIEAWVQPSSFANAAFPTIYSEGNRIVALGLNNGRLESWVNNDGTRRLVSTNALTLNDWNHVALVYEGTRRLLYLNGVLDGGTNTPAIIDDSSGASIGQSTINDASTLFQGAVDELSLYNVALTALQISNLYSAGVAGKCFGDSPLPEFVLDPISQNGFLGGQVTLTALAAGPPAIEYQWLFNGGPVAGAVGYSLTLSNLVFEHAGFYSLRATNPYGSSTSAVARLVVPWCTDAPTNKVAWWPADGSALDAISHHDGAVWGGTTSGSGVAGSAFCFNGVDAYVAVPDVPDLSPHVGTNGEMSVEAWVRLDQLPQPDGVTAQNRRTLLAKGGPGQWEYMLSLTTAGVPEFYLFTPAGATVAGVTGGQIITGQWHHVVATLKKGDFLKLYQDGRPEPVGTSTNFTGDTADGNSPLYLGRRGDAQFLKGWVDEVTLYSRALTADEVGALYAADGSGKCAGAPGPAPDFVRQPENQTGYLLLGAGLTSFAIGTPRPDYQWYRSNATEWVVVPGATQASLVLSNLTVEAEGNYRVTASNRFGVIVSESAYLKVVPHDILNGGEHFEKGWNGWETDGSVWQVGTQTGQTNGLAATVLDGNYPWLASSRLVSPVIQMPSTGASEEVVLQFRHWFSYYSGYWNDGYNSGWGGNDYGQVQVQAFNTNTLQWSAWSGLLTVTRYSAGWSLAQIDLSAYAGSKIRIGFYHTDVSEDSDPFRGLQHFETSGWYLDDVRIILRPVDILMGTEGFETGWDGWYAENGVWAVGSGGGHSGSNYIATVPGGAYPWLTTSRLVSPVIQVPLAAATEEVVLRFWHWFNYYSGYWNDGYNSGYGGNDYGQVQVQVFDTNALQWSSWSGLLTVTRYSAGWTPAQIDLSAFAGRKIRIGFYHADVSEDGDSFRGLQHYETSGWYFDDVSIVVRPVEMLLETEGFETGWHGWYAENGVWAVGSGGGHSGSNYIATVPGGAYPWLTTSRLVSPVIQVPSTAATEEVVLRFWHWFNYYSGYWNDGYNSGYGGNDYGQVQVQVFDTNTLQWSSWSGLLTVTRYSAGWTPAQIDLSAYAGRKIRIGFYHADVSEDGDSFRGLQHYETSGWDLDDVSVVVRPVEMLFGTEGFESGWGGWYAENGVWAVGSGGGHSGSNYIATVPGGAYPWLTTSRLVSPVIQVPSTAATEEVVLRFWHWFNYYSGYWNDGYNSGDGGDDKGYVQVQVFQTNTLQWSGWNPVLTISRIAPTWASTNISLTAYSGQKIRVGFYHTDVSEDNDPFRGLQHYESSGWYIDDIFVKRGNLAIASVSDKTVNERAALNFPVAVIGTKPESCVSYQLVDPPPGATIDPTTGVFSWEPEECQAPGTYNIGIYVVDFCNNEANDLGFVRVTVNEVNELPWLLPAEGAAHVGRTNKIALCSGDPDCPRNPLNYSLLGPVPAGAIIDPNTGVFQWAPTAAQVGTNHLTVRLCDGGAPNYCVTNTLTVTVSPNAPHYLDIEPLAAGAYRFTVREGTATVDYVLQQASELCGCPCRTEWQDVMRVSPTATPYAFEYSTTDVAPARSRFFRLVEVPRL